MDVFSLNIISYIKAPAYISGITLSADIFSFLILFIFTSICGNADMLLQGKLNEDKKEKVYSYIYDDSFWLLNLVENLLSVTRIEDGGMKIKKQADMLEDLIEEALKHISRKSREFSIRVSMEDEMQLVNVDSRLILQVINN